jgi:hypothetical protein
MGGPHRKELSADPTATCLSLVRAVLDRASRGWREVVMTPAAVRLLQELRRQLHHPSRLEEVADQPVTSAA